MAKNSKFLSRRQFGTSLAAFGVLSPAILRAQAAPGTETEAPQFVTSSFVTERWQDYFNNRRNGETYKIYPTSVPLTEQLTRRGRTSIVRKVDGPEWRATPNMLARDPDLPRYVGPGPQNPLGTHALYLGWQYYRIHGTNDTRKIGRQASNGCIGLYNEDIEVMFGLAKVGTQVLNSLTLFDN